jgi:uncharacterized membrane protein
LAPNVAYEHVVAPVEAGSVIQSSARGWWSSDDRERQRVEWFALWNSIIIVVVMIAWGYPLSVLSKRAGA